MSRGFIVFCTFFLIIYSFTTSSGFQQGDPVIILRDTNLPIINGAIGRSEYQTVYNASEIGMMVYFEHDGTNLYVGLQSNGTGWVGIGWKEYFAGKVGANLVVLSYDSENGANATDDYGVKYNEHESDISLGGHDNITEYAVTESGGYTYAEFSYPLVTYDEYDINLTIGETYGFIVAQSFDSDDFSQTHGSGLYVYINNVQLTSSVSLETTTGTNNTTTQSSNNTSWEMLFPITIIILGFFKKKRN
ncbi:MAG: DOMON domain-containing protein [Candidatus Hodarchaeales archaeon]